MMILHKKNSRYMVYLTLTLIVIINSNFSLNVYPSDEKNYFENFIPSKVQRIHPKANSESAQLIIDGSLDENLSHTYPFIYGSGNIIDPYVLTNIQFNSSINKTYNLYVKNVHSHLVITNLTFENFGTFETSCNIRIDSCENITISNCSLENAFSNLMITSCSNIMVSGNSIVNSSLRGIFLFGSNNISIINNTISNGHWGIYILVCEYVLIDSNLFFNNFDVAIKTGHADFNIISRNDFIDNKNGIFLDKSNENLIDQNYFHNNKKIAIALYTSNNNNISSNCISKSRYGVAFEFPWSSPNGFFDRVSSGDQIPKGNFLYNNTMTQIAFKPIKFWLGDNISINNTLEQNFWSAFLFISICILFFGGMSFLIRYSIRKHKEIKKILKSYEERMNQKERIVALEKELEEYKRKFFELNSEFKSD